MPPLSPTHKAHSIAAYLLTLSFVFQPPSPKVTSLASILQEDVCGNDVRKQDGEI